MKPEVFQRKDNNYPLIELIKSYEEDEKLFKESSLVESMRRLLVAKRKKFDFIITPPLKEEKERMVYPDKYIAEFRWDKKKTTNGNSFCHVIIFISEAKEGKIIVSAAEETEIKKEKFADKDFINKVLLKALENPIQRSNNPFYQEDLPLSSERLEEK